MPRVTVRTIHNTEFLHGVGIRLDQLDVISSSTLQFIHYGGIKLSFVRVWVGVYRVVRFDYSFYPPYKPRGCPSKVKTTTATMSCFIRSKYFICALLYCICMMYKQIKYICILVPKVRSDRIFLFQTWRLYGLQNAYITIIYTLNWSHCICICSELLSDHKTRSITIHVGYINDCIRPLTFFVQHHVPLNTFISTRPLIHTSAV